jgi:transposase
MSSLPTYVGLDYHQDSVQVCVLDSQGEILTNRSVVNEAGTIQEISSRFGAPRRVAIEACCGAADLAEELTTQWQLPVQMGHPGYVKRMKQSPDKTDYSDAHLLADLVRVNYLPQVWLAPRSTRELRRLVRHRGQLVHRRKDTKLRIRGMLRENRLKCRHARPWTKAWYAWLTNEAGLSESDRWVLEDHLEELVSLSGRIAAVEAKIQMEIKDDPIVERLMQEKGVGLITAVTFRAEVGRVSRFKSGKQLSRFCGVTPRNASSGARQADAGLIRAGNPALRAVLIELAHRLIRSPGKWSSRAEKMMQRGKAKNVIVAAIANRWIRWIYHELRREGAEEQTSAPAQQKGHAPTAATIAST